MRRVWISGAWISWAFVVMTAQAADESTPLSDVNAGAWAPAQESSHRSEHADVQAQMKAAAELTQQQCYGLIHHDTDEFAQCVNERLRDRRLKAPQRLGTQYFGWVGAVNSMRIGMPGAREAAVQFLSPLRAMQRRLQLSDAELCRSVPGDCVARTARMLQMERERRDAEQSDMLQRSPARGRGVQPVPSASP